MLQLEKQRDGANAAHKAVKGVRAIGVLTLFATLSACALSPGERMLQPPTLPTSNGEDGTTAGSVQVPITEVNLYTIGQMRKAAAAAGSNVSELFAAPSPYKIGPGDVLQITVWDHPELAAALGQPNNPTRNSDAAVGFLVDQDGTVQFPYAGTIHVAGQTSDQVQHKLYTELSKTMVKPQVTVRIASFRSQQVYLDGEVRTPGAVSVNDIPMTLTEAVGRAGGYTNNADQSRVEVVRENKTYEVNIGQMLANGQNPSRILLKNGDLVRVLSRNDYGVYVMGEVGKPATVAPMTNGRLTLADAISQTGSFAPESSDPKQLYVIRGGQNGSPMVYHLDATSPVSMVLANQFDLQPKDVVYVDASGLVRFSRVLNLLLPLVNAGLTGAIVTK